MQRANDNSNQSVEQMRHTVQTLALRVNQLERMLDGKELREAKVEGGSVYERGTRLSLSNGMMNGEWRETNVTGGVDSLIAGTGISVSSATGDVTVTNTGVGIDYDYVYVGGKRLTPPTKTTNFLKVYLDGVTACEWVAAMPETMDSDSEVFDVSKNRIYLSGEFAG